VYWYSTAIKTRTAPLKAKFEKFTQNLKK